MEFGIPQCMEGYDEKFKTSLSYDISDFTDYENILYQLMDAFCKRSKQYSVSCNKFDIRIVKEYIDKNYFEEIKITMFVEKYYLSREYLMKLFKQEFGCGIYEYVQKVRMEKAKELLSDVSVKIQNISQLMGYSDHNYFSKAFRNYYGMSPTGYRSLAILTKGAKSN